jgi:hypothetical protein
MATKRPRWDVLRAWIDEQGWRRGAELGVFNGQTFLALLRDCPALELVGIDRWTTEEQYHWRGPGNPYTEQDVRDAEERVRRGAAPYGRRARLLKMDTASAAQEFPDGFFDFIFLDADHTYAGVSRDLQAWRAKVRAGGALTGHDAHAVDFPGVGEALTAWLPGWTWQPDDDVWRWDVPEAKG